MANDEPQISFEQPRSTFGTWLGVVLLFAIFAVFVWVVMGAMPRGDTYEQKRSEARLEKLKTAREEHAKAVEGYGWVNKEKGVARIPVRRAMELSMAELAQRKPMPANPIEPAAVQQPGMQATAPVAPSPAQAATPQPGGSPLPQATEVEGPNSQMRGQPTGAANPPNAAPGSQPGPQATAGASPPAGASQPQPGSGDPGPTPVQSPPGTPLPVPGRDPMASPSPAKQP